VQNNVSFGVDMLVPLLLQPILQDFDEWFLRRRENLLMYRKKREKNE
jgi:hypothetical protein